MNFAAVADPGQRHDFLSEIAPGYRDTGHDGNQVAEHRGRRYNVAHLQVRDVAAIVLTPRGRLRAPHELREKFRRAEAAHQQGSNIANHRRDPVLRPQRIRRAHRNRLLSEAAVEPANDFILAK